MDSESGYSQTDAVKWISNILREPAPSPGDESREKAAEIHSEPSPARASNSVGAAARGETTNSVEADLRPARGKSPEMAAESSTFPSPDGAAGSPPPSSGGGRFRAAVWRFLVFCVEPIFRRLREYLLEPLASLHEKLDTQAAETRASTERIRLQVQVMRGALDVLPKQLVHLEFRSRNFAKQIARLESQLGILADQLEHSESQGATILERIEPSGNPESQVAGDKSRSVSSEAVVIVGSGGHAKVVIELIRAEGKYQIKGCTGLGEGGFVLDDVPILGTDSLLPALLASGAKKAFVAIGDNHGRVRLLAQVSEIGFELINAVSPDAVVSRSATLGRGIAIMAGAIVNASAEIGDGAIINTNAAVDHDCRIGSGAHIGPGSALAGCVEVGCESFLGAGTCVIPGIRIGSRVIVGAGSVVVQDLPDDVTAMGVPARIVGEPRTPSN